VGVRGDGVCVLVRGALPPENRRDWCQCGSPMTLHREKHRSSEGIGFRRAGCKG